jgi:hypothetical protein
MTEPRPGPVYWTRVPWEYQYRYDGFVNAHPERFAVPPWPEAYPR